MAMLKDDKLESASFHKRACEVFGLPQDRADKIASQMHQLGVGSDDAYSLLFLATGRIEAMTETIPADMMKAGKAIIGGIKKTVDEQMKSLPDRLSRDVTDATAASIAATVENTVLQNIDRAKRVDSIKIGAMVGVAAIALFLSAGAGYLARGSYNIAASQEVAAVQARPDWSIWKNWIDNNDARAVRANWCGSGQLVMAGGQRRCQPMLNETPPVAVGPVQAVQITFAEWLWGINPTLLLILGVVGGWIGNIGWRAWRAPR